MYFWWATSKLEENIIFSWDADAGRASTVMRVGLSCGPGGLWSGSPWDVTGLGFRRWFQGSGSLHGLTHLNRSSHAGKVSVAARGHGSPQICQITCKHIRPEGNVCHAKSPAPSPWPDPLPFLCLVEQEVGPQSGGTRPQRPGPEQGGIWGEESSSVGVRGREQEQWLQQEPASVSQTRTFSSLYLSYDTGGITSNTSSLRHFPIMYWW